MHQHPGTDDEILDAITKKYIGSHIQNVTHPEYTGEPNELLDRPITLAEVKQGLAALTRNTAPGIDQVTNQLLRNLDDSVQALTKFYNKHWESGTLPEDWKHAHIVLIPKPNKPTTLDNLRPISLTSCLGKLLEHIILNRLQPYLEDRELLPETM